MAENWLAVYRGDAQGETAESITKLGLDFGLMTQYTSFVAVEERVVNESGAPRRVEVPIELPDGVSYEGIFGDQATEKVSALGHMPAAPGIAAQPRSTLPTLGNVQPFAKNSYPADAESRTPVSHGVTPVQETFRKESVSVSKKSESSTALRERMDPALHVLLDGARDGVYADGKVNVQDGKVTLYLRLAEINDAILDALRATGAEILTLRAAQRGVLVKMQVDALKGLAYVEGLLRIEVPPV
jgi:Ca-activated chloride channel family protein